MREASWLNGYDTRPSIGQPGFDSRCLLHHPVDAGVTPRVMPVIGSRNTFIRAWPAMKTAALHCRVKKLLIARIKIHLQVN